MQGREGDVLRCEEFEQEPCEPPAWGVLTEDLPINGDAYVVFLIDGPNWGSALDGKPEQVVNGDDEFEIVPLDQVPDEVLTALAVWRLTGDQ